MADQRTMAELLRAPTEGYAEAIVDRYKDLIRACPHPDFTELHQLDTFYNALNPTDQDSLNAAAGGNLLERSTQDVLTIIENKSKQTSIVTTAMTAMLKQFQATPPPAPVKAVEETCVTCGGAHPYYQCLAVGGKTYSELRDNIQRYISAAAVNYNQAPAQQNQNVHLNELEKVRRMNEANMKAMQTQIDMVKNELRNEMKSSIQTSLSNQTNEIKNIMASLLQMNTASTSGSGSLPSNTVANPKGELKAITTHKETFTDPDLAEYTIKVPPPPFTFPTDFVIIDYESDPKVPLILGRPFLRTARALNDVHGEEMILHDGDERLTLNMRHDTSSYSNQPQKESINLINVFNNSSDDFLKDLFPSKPSGNLTFSPHPDIFDSKGCNVLSEKLLDLDSTKYLQPSLHDNPLSGSTTYFSNKLLEEFADELPLKYDDNL
nr:reverse transcriptase domain-containing protein [Tanacetum cinerariifolium]